MIKLSVLLKWGIGILLVLGGLGTMAAMAYHAYPDNSIAQYPQSIFDFLSKKPKAPQIVDQKTEGSCGARVWWVDNSLNEDGVYFDRRVVGQPNFVTIQVTGPHAGIPGSFDEGNLPIGNYEYRVGVFNEYGTSYSNISQIVVVDDPACGNEPLPVKPLNPVITALERVKGETCSVRVYFNDNSTDEDGIRIYRSEWNDPDVLLADLPPNNGPTGSYEDKNIPPGHYTYQVSAYNANGESFSQLSDEFEITAQECNPTVTSVNPGVIALITPQVMPTVTPTSDVKAQACTWKASINVFVRSGPGASIYPDITAVESGIELPVIGQSEDEQFWAVQLKPRVNGYVPKANKYGQTSGECNVAVLEDPKAPDQPVPEQPATTTPQCRDGIDNDNDRLVDMRDRGCSSPDDNSE